MLNPKTSDSCLVFPADHGRCDDQASRLVFETTFNFPTVPSIFDGGITSEPGWRDFGLACFLTLLHRHTNQYSLSIGLCCGVGDVRSISYEFDDQTVFSGILPVPAYCDTPSDGDAEMRLAIPTMFGIGTGHEIDSVMDFARSSSLVLFWIDAGETVTLRLAFDGKLFRAERMKEFLAQFEVLVKQAVTSPESRVLDYSLVTEFGRTILPDATAVIDIPRYPLLTEVFSQLAATSPADIAIRHAGQVWTYAQLELSSASLAMHLCNLGVVPGDVVAVSGPRSFGIVSSVLGVLRSGGTLLTIDPKLPLERQNIIMQQAGAGFLVRVGEIASIDERALRVIRVFPETGSIVGLTVADLPVVSLPVLVPGAPAYIFFTSGSTGTPKGVVGSHQGLAHFLDWQRKTFDIGPGDRAAQITTLSFDMVLRDMFLVLTSGATLCIPADADVLDPSAILAWMAAEHISILHVVPSLFRAWINHVPPGLRLPKLRRVFLAGEPLTDTLILSFRAVLGDAALITNFYGPTETTLIKCFHSIVEPEAGMQPIGRPQPQTQILILNQSGQLCGVNEIGQIAIRTPFRTLGYLNAPEATAIAFIPNPFREDPSDLVYMTGDSGCYRTDGLLVMRGRIDNQVKIRGMRVEPGEIEAALGHCPGIREAAVVAHENTSGSKYLAAYIVLGESLAKKASAPSMLEIREFLRARLPENMVPANFVVLEALPLLPNGKVNKKALAVPSLSTSAAVETASTAGDAPENDREAELLAIWQSVLGHGRVGVNDSFVELGGDSLTAISALVRMQHLGIPDTFARGIFQGWSIRQITQMANGKDSDVHTVTMTPKARTHLFVNVLRGLLVAILVAGHWFEGLLNRLPESWRGVQDVLMPLFNIATPGFAILFGLSLGYIYLPKFLTDSVQTSRALRQGAWLCFAGTIIRGVPNTIILLIGNDAVDSTEFFNSFYGALLYYAAALATAPIWFRLIEKRSDVYRAVLVLAVISYLSYHLSLSIFLDHEQKGLLQLFRLMLVAKFNYFNMSVGAFFGLAAGIYLHRWTLKKRPLHVLSGPLLMAGSATAAIGLFLLFVTTGSFHEIQNEVIIPLWKWIFYFGILLLTASFLSAALTSYDTTVAPVRVVINLLGVLGQISLPVFVFHNMVLSTKALLIFWGFPSSIALTIPLCLFFGGCGWMMFRLYDLYYGAISSRSDRPTAAMVAL